MTVINRKLNIRVTEKIRGNRGFSLFEMLVAMTVLSLLLVILMGAVSAVSTMYINNDDKTRSDEKGRAVIELISRELTPAVIDTRMQFVVLPGEELTDVGAIAVAEASPAAIWMAPLGPGGDLRCVGYYLTRNAEQKHYRLKRIYIRSDDPYSYFPELVNLENARDITSRTSPVDATWFLGNWDQAVFDDITDSNERVRISTVSDGVAAFWIRALDSMGNPVPYLSSATVHPKSDLIYNSAAYFYMADGNPFEGGTTLVYLKKNRLTMKANRLPAALEIMIVMISEDGIARGGAIPAQENVLVEAGQQSMILDLDASLSQFTDKLKTAGFAAPRIFRTTVKLTNGG